MGVLINNKNSAVGGVKLSNGYRMKFLVFSLTLIITSYVFGLGSNIYVCTDETGHKTFSEIQCSNDQVSQTKRVNSYFLSKKNNSKEEVAKNFESKRANSEVSNVNNINLEAEIRRLEKYKEKIKLRLIRIEDDERKATEKVEGYEVKAGQIFTAKELMNSSSYKKTKRIKAKYKRQRDAMNKKLESVNKDLVEIRKLQGKGS